MICFACIWICPGLGVRQLTPHREEPVHNAFNTEGKHLVSVYFSGVLELTLVSFQEFSVQFSSVAQSCLTLCDPMKACQASLSITNSRSLLKPMSIESVMPSSHLILCRPLLLLPPIPPSIGVFSNESTLRMRRPEYWSFSFSISPSNEHPGLTSFRMVGSPCSPRDSQVFSNTTVQKHQFFGAQLSL